MNTAKLDLRGGAVNSGRNYDSPLRREQAQRTRQRVVDSARELFGELGYPATSIAAVARRAGVSADTVYKSFGSKNALLKAVLDATIGGDVDDVPLLEREGPRRMRAEPDQRRQIELFAAGVTEQLERVRPVDDILRRAAAVDPGAAALRDDVQLRQRRAAMRTVVSWIAANGPLRGGVGEDEAAAVAWTLTSPEVHAMLRDTWGWPRERFEAWVRDALLDSLLPPPGEDGAADPRR